MRLEAKLEKNSLKFSIAAASAGEWAGGGAGCWMRTAASVVKVSMALLNNTLSEIAVKHQLSFCLFLGGIRRAQAANSHKNDFVWSEILSSLAWACMLLPTALTLVRLFTGSTGIACFNLHIRPLATAKAFKTLRLCLSLTAISLHLAALAQIGFKN